MGTSKAEAYPVSLAPTDSDRGGIGGLGCHGEHHVIHRHHLSFSRDRDTAYTTHLVHGVEEMTDDWSLKGKSIKGLIAMPSDGMETHPTSSPTPIKDEWFHKEDIDTLRQKLIERMEKIFFINVLPKDAPLTISQQSYLKGMFGGMLNSINLLFGDPQPNITHIEKYGNWNNYWKELNKRFGVEE